MHYQTPRHGWILSGFWACTGFSATRRPSDICEALCRWVSYLSARPGREGAWCSLVQWTASKESDGRDGQFGERWKHEARDERDYRFLFSDLKITKHALLICCLLQNRFRWICFARLKLVHVVLMMKHQNIFALCIETFLHLICSFYLVFLHFFFFLDEWAGLSLLCLCCMHVGVLAWDIDSCLGDWTDFCNSDTLLWQQHRYF